MIESVTVQRFKCLLDVTVEVGPFNVLIGPNDSGKSSFLQAIAEPGAWLQGQPTRFGEPSRQGHVGPAVMLRDPNVTVTIKTQGQYVNATIESIGQPAVVTSANSLSTNAAAASLLVFRATQPVMLDPVEIATPPSARGTGVLHELVARRGKGTAAHFAQLALGDRARYEAVQDAVRRLTRGRVKEVVVKEFGADYALAFRLHDDTVIDAKNLSQGLLVYVGFLALVHREDAPAVLLIEEPENCLHPFRLHELVELLRTLTTHGVQIFMTTHSPDLLNACKPEEVLVFRRPDPDSGTEIHHLPPDFKRVSLRAGLGEVWASSGEEGLLDMLPAAQPIVREVH